MSNGTPGRVDHDSTALDNRAAQPTTALWQGLLGQLSGWWYDPELVKANAMRVAAEVACG